MTQSTRRKPMTVLCALCVAALPLGGCKKGAKKGKASGSAAVTTKSAAAAGGKHFDKSIAKKKCKLLTADMVASAFGVPKGKLNQDSDSLSCTYSLKNSKKRTLNAQISWISVEKSAKAAASAFNNETQNVSAKRLAKAKAMMDKEIQKDKNLSGQQKQLAKGIGHAAAGGGGGISYVDVPDVCDQARMKTDGDILYARVGNMRFQVEAYHGARMPMPKQLTGKGMEAANDAWMEKTMPQRKKDAIELARAVCKAL